MVQKKRIWLIMARLERGQSQKEVADSLGIKQPTYSSYENGRRNPPMDTAIKISKFFDLPLEQWVNRLEEKGA